MSRLLPRALVGALLTALALVAAGAALGDKAKFDRADQAAARRIVLHPGDLGSGWKGGSRKPDLSDSTVSCKGYHPKLPALVATGAAETQYAKGPLSVDSEAEILQTAQMVSADWRAELRPGIVSCLRQLIGKELGAKGSVVSVRHLDYPKLATYTTDFRIVASEKVQGKAIRIVVDVLLVGRGRTELTLITTAPDGARATVQAAEIRLARIMVGRTPAS